MTNNNNENKNIQVKAKENIHIKNVTEFSKEDAVNLALQIERCDAAIKQMKDKLKAYVNLNGSVETDSKTWGFVPAYKWEFTEESYTELAATLSIDDINPYKYFKLGATEIEKMLKAGIDEEFLMQFGSRVPTNPTFKAVAKQN